MVLDMLHQRYPDHVENYNSYSYGVQRADAARYFILYEYGGVYIDMDIACEVPLNDVIAYVTDRHAAVGLPDNSWIRGGVTNDLLLATAKHRFFAQTINSLPHYNSNYGLPYVTVMYSTGPNFLTDMFKEYRRELEQRGTTDSDIVVLPHSLTHETNGYFRHTVGSTWHAADGRILYGVLLNRHYAALFLVVCLAVIGYTQRARCIKRWRHTTVAA